MKRFQIVFVSSVFCFVFALTFMDASIKSSLLRPSFQNFRLIHAIRNAEDLPFSQWADAIGDGNATEVAINDMLPVVHDPQALIDFVFPTDILANPDACVNRSILAPAPTNIQINQYKLYNDTILCKIDGEERMYLAADTLKESKESEFLSPESALDYVAHQTPTGLPNHKLTVKTNSVFRLLRNFSVEQQMVKSIRVTAVGTRLISVQLIREGRVDSHRLEDILIP